MALGYRDLSRRGTTFQQDIDDFLVLNLQLGNGFSQSTGYLVQRKNGLLTGNNGVGVTAQRGPVLLYRIDFVAQRLRHSRQADALVTLREVSPALIELVPGLLQRRECLLRAGCRFHGVLGDLLGQYAELSRVSDVLVIVIRLRVDVREVREQQNDRNDQYDKQAGGQRIATHPAQ